MLNNKGAEKTTNTRWMTFYITITLYVCVWNKCGPRLVYTHTHRERERRLMMRDGMVGWPCWLSFIDRFPFLALDESVIVVHVLLITYADKWRLKIAAIFVWHFLWIIHDVKCITVINSQTFVPLLESLNVWKRKKQLRNDWRSYLGLMTPISREMFRVLAYKFYSVCVNRRGFVSTIVECRIRFTSGSLKTATCSVVYFFFTWRTDKAAACAQAPLTCSSPL